MPPGTAHRTASPCAPVPRRTVRRSTLEMRGRRRRGHGLHRSGRPRRCGRRAAALGGSAVEPRRARGYDDGRRRRPRRQRRPAADDADQGAAPGVPSTRSAAARPPDAASRAARDQGQASARSPSRTSPATVERRPSSATDPRDIAMSMLGDYGWSSGRVRLPRHRSGSSESNWRHATNRPPAPRHPAGAARPRRWRRRCRLADQPGHPDRVGSRPTSSRRYGSPCGAWYFKQGNNWYCPA